MDILFLKYASKKCGGWLAHKYLVPICHMTIKNDFGRNKNFIESLIGLAKESKKYQYNKITKQI